MITKISQLENLTKKALKKYGYSPKEIKIIKDILLYAQLRGNNQGIVKLIGKGIPRRSDAQLPVVVKKSPVSALVDGNKTHAMVVMNYITDIAIKKAKQKGVGIAGNYNTSESTGAIGYYVNKIAKQGLIGLAFSSSPFQTTAACGSTQARFCTNPIAYAIPTVSDEPIVFDMTTSAMAYYGLIEAKTAGKAVPEEMGYNAQGIATTDPAEIMSGALKTIAGQKGSGLALLGQILAGAFVGASSFDNNSDNAGNLILAIDPSIFTTADTFKNEVSRVTQVIKESTKLDGATEILIPGERGNKLTKQRVDSEEIEVEDNLLNALKAVVKTL